MGPTADLLESIEGNYNGTAPDPVSPLNGLRKEFGSENVIYAPGSSLAEGSPTPIPSAYLRTDASLKTAGLKGEYFDIRRFEGRAEVGARGRADQFRLEPRGARGGFSRQDICGALDGRIAAASAGRLCAELARAAADRSKCDDRRGGWSTSVAARMPDRVRLYIDDKLVMDSHSNPAEARLSFADTQSARDSRGIRASA